MSFLLIVQENYFLLVLSLSAQILGVCGGDLRIPAVNEMCKAIQTKVMKLAADQSIQPTEIPKNRKNTNFVFIVT